MSLLELLQSANPEKQSLILDAIRTERVAEARLLSYGQKRLWFLYLLEPNSPAYNIALSLRLRGALDVEALQSGLDEVVKRHAILRTKFVTVGNEPVQVVEERSCFSIERGDLSGWTEGEREAEVLRLAEEEGRKGFDLSRGPLLRARLLRLGEEEHVLLITMHHIVSDGWSMGVLVQELNALYGGYVAGKEVKLPELEIQYADYAYWQRQWLQGEVLEEQLGYWREKLEGVARLELPTDGARPATVSYEGGSVSLELSEEASAGLKELSRENGATLFMGLLAGFVVLLSRYSGQEDIAVGTDVANRTWKETESLVGFFVNQLVLRTDVSGDPSFRELLGRVREVCLGAYTHQDLPFEKLVEELSPERDLSRTPLFQVKLTLENTPLVTGCFEQLNIEFLDIDQTSAKVDLQLHITEQGGGLQLHWIYRKDLFEAETIERMMGHYERVLKAAIGEPGRRISELEMLGEEERRRLLVEWNDTAREYGGEGTVHEMFEAQAERTPEAVALVCGEEELSYGELNRRANQVAHYLRELGVGPEVLVGVCLERSIGMVVGILGVLKAGGAYVPLDPEHPMERLNTMRNSLRISHLLVQRKSVNQWREESAKQNLTFLELSQNGELELCSGRDSDVAAATNSKTASQIRAHSDNLAYVIFTSGSTGIPKGVMVRHRPVVNLIEWMNRSLEIGPSDRVLLVASLGFDLSVYDIFGLLAVGGSILVAKQDEVHEPDALLAFMKFKDVTIWDSAPAALQQVAAFIEPSTACPSSRLRLILLSGDWIPVRLPESITSCFPTGKVIALGGATEAVVWSNYHVVIAADSKRVSIPYGRPIQNARYYILSKNLKCCPIGVEGDLFIGGECLSDGYARQPGLTANSFMPDLYSVVPGRRMSRTGDRARWHSDGEIAFLGRKDNQVKIRGFRIELGEVEHALRLCPAVQEAIVVAHEQGFRDTRLIGYYIPAVDKRATESQIIEALRLRIPDYMVPTHLVPLQSWPVTANGKLDRRALPEPESRKRLKEDVAVLSDLEEAIGGVWRSLLNVPTVERNDNFFDLGA